MIIQELANRYAFFRGDWSGRGTFANSAEYAISLARAEMRAQDRLVCVWHEEDEEWAGDCPAPDYLLWGAVYLDDGCVPATPLASLGMVGVDSLSDPYLRMCAAELFQEALATLDAEDQESANVLASRATYAGASA